MSNMPNVNMNASLQATKIGGIAIGTVLGVIATYSLIRTSMLTTKLTYTQLMKLKSEGFDYDNPLSMANIFDSMEAAGAKLFGINKGKTTTTTAKTAAPAKTANTKPANNTATMQQNMTSADGGQTIKEYMLSPSDEKTFSCEGNAKCGACKNKNFSMVGTDNFFGGVEEEYVQRLSDLTGRREDGTMYWKPAGLTPAHNWGTSY